MPDNGINILYLADVVGEPGLIALEGSIESLRKDYSPHFIICNVENVSGGYGFSQKKYKLLKEMGISAFTSGNHIWDKKEIINKLHYMPSLLRPANYPAGSPGEGVKIFEVSFDSLSVRVAVINLIGRVFMNPVDCPFRTADAIINQIQDSVHVIFVDFHAEATSEKEALGYYLDGRVSAVVGSHTHVQTSDARILPGGTGYITDAGMTGVKNSVLGMDVGEVIEKFLYMTPGRLKVAKGDECILQGVILRVDIESGKCTDIRSFSRDVVTSSG